MKVYVATQQSMVNIWRVVNPVKKTPRHLLKKSNGLHLCNFGLMLWTHECVVRLNIWLSWSLLGAEYVA